MDTRIVLVTTVLVIAAVSGNSPFTSPGLMLMEYLDWSNTTVINAFDTSTGGKTYLVEYTYRQFTLLSVYPTSQTCIVYDSDNQAICKLLYRGRNWYEPVCAETFGTVNGLAVDDVRGFVFWTDADYNAVMMARITDLSRHHVIIDTLLDTPGGVAVHPDAGLLFWSDFGSDPKLERSTVTGEERATIARGGKPYMLTIDRVSNRLYWINQDTYTLESCDTDGHGRRELFLNLDRTTTAFGWSSLVVYRSRLLVTWNSSRRVGVLSLGLGPESQSTRTVNTLTASQQLAVVGELPPLRVMATRQLCGRCAPSRRDRGSVYFTTVNGSMYRMPAYPLTTCSSRGPSVSLVHAGNLSVFATDAVHNIIFAYNSERKSIVELSEDVYTGHWNRIRDVVMVANPVKSIAVDWMSMNIMWAERWSQHISVANYDGHYRKWLISRARADDIVVDPHKRRIFWLVGTPGYVESADLDGRSRTVIRYHDRRFTSLTVDCVAERLIIYDAQADELLSVSYNGSLRLVIGARFGPLALIVVVKDYVIMRNTSNALKMVNTRTRRTLRAITVSDDVIVHMELNHLDNHINTRAIMTGATCEAEDTHSSGTPDLTFGCYGGPCVNNNGGCEQLCLPNPSTRNCACGFGYHEVPHTNECSTNLMNTTFFLVVDQRLPAIYQYYHDDRTPLIARYTIVPAMGLRQPYAVTYDAIGRMIYWSDIEQKTVSKIDMNGHFQEIVYGDPSLYALDIAMSIPLRLLFIADYQHGRILALNVNTGSTATLHPVDRAYGLAVGLHNRYLYATGFGRMPHFVRMALNGSAVGRVPVIMQPGKLAVHSSGVYVIDLQSIVRLNHTGSVLVITPLPSGHLVQFVTSGEDNLYWTETTTKMIYRFHVSMTWEATPVGLEGALLHPAGLVYFGASRTYPSITCTSPCSGTCVPLGNNLTTCLPTVTPGVLPQEGVCTVPPHNNITFGRVEFLRHGARVPEGTRLRVKCLPAHSLVSSVPSVCLRENWTLIPQCQPDTKIYGTENGGWTIFTTSGDFYVYDWMTIVYVVVIGGGGGGYQGGGANAGDGQLSRFGSNTLALTAEGGSGGTMLAGGQGGAAEGSYGSDGSLDHAGCSRGGSVWSSVPSKTHSMFCANDYGPTSCFTGDIMTGATCGSGDAHSSGTPDLAFGFCEDQPPSNVTLRIRRDCRFDTTCKYFGDGGESLHGGSGGGGGYSKSSRSLAVNYRRQLIHIDVGRGGEQSYTPSGGGVVILWWGWDSVLSDVETAYIESICNNSTDP